MKQIGLLINETKPLALEAAERLVHAYASRNDLCLLTREVVARQLPGTLCRASTDIEIAQSDFVIVFGGDGTLLAAARLVAPYGTPILGIHLGHFGFITEIAPENLILAVDAALRGDCRIEERLMLQGVIQRANTSPEWEESPEETLVAMNDIVAASGAVRMVHVRAQIGDDLLATYAADGVIVASPTGSTGYSLSAGGPLVHPAAPVMIITPIAPHTLNARALIVPDDETIHLTIERQTRDVVLVSVDGQLDITLHPGDTVSVSRAPFNVRLLTQDGPNFYQKIRSRWHYGERILG
jgi:NAD+ kinase